MKIKLNKSFGSNMPVDEFDVRQVKRALNRLGYYRPPKEIGLTEIPDREVFEALKAFQSDQGLDATGELRPEDDAVRVMNEEIKQTKEQKYIWRTVGDDKVRPTHSALEGEIRSFSDSPAPGEESHCRCSAEVIEDAINPVYPELALIPALKLGRVLKIIREFYKKSRKKEYTDHGAERSSQRKASQKDIQEAIRTAKETGNVTTKIGKYGTPQNVYRGSNGLTVVEETQGRNAGKIITLWWNR